MPFFPSVYCGNFQFIFCYAYPSKVLRGVQQVMRLSIPQVTTNRVYNNLDLLVRECNLISKSNFLLNMLRSSEFVVIIPARHCP
jgi:hypothetical protein